MPLSCFNLLFVCFSLKLESPQQLPYLTLPIQFPPYHSTPPTTTIDQNLFPNSKCPESKALISWLPAQPINGTCDTAWLGRLISPPYEQVSTIGLKQSQILSFFFETDCWQKYWNRHQIKKRLFTLGRSIAASPAAGAVEWVHADVLLLYPVKANRWITGSLSRNKELTRPFQSPWAHGRLDPIRPHQRSY